MSSLHADSVKAFQDSTSKKKRAYRACTHCRLRKAKCEFDNPTGSFDPPCVRCLREGHECTFLPSRRGGKDNVIKGRLLKRRLSQISASDDDNDSSSHGSVASDSKTIPHSLATSSIRNPSDAHDILTQTVYSPSGDYRLELSPENTQTAEKTSRSSDGCKPIVPEFSANISAIPDRRIAEFPLVRSGVVTPNQIWSYIKIFFARHHHYLPIFPANRIPRNDEAFAAFAFEEPFLLTVIIVIVSHFESDTVHQLSWKYLRTKISELTFGAEASVGSVEGLLLLSENIPRQLTLKDTKAYETESRFVWTITGLAIRISYMLGLDQKTLILPDKVHDDAVQRERLAWTYCYMLDRQCSIRLGKAFWSRGPGLCFQNPEASYEVQTVSHLNFPTMAPQSTQDEDYASFIQSQIELTQILTNVHDTLYPSRDRTIALLQIGEYYKILDDFTRSFTAFELTWRPKVWKISILDNIVWISYYYAKLYAYGFAFQAHVRRTTAKRDSMPASKDRKISSIIFPRGLGGAADAKFILEAKNSAFAILNICINSLQPVEALAYFPLRFSCYFSYAAVFLIKVAFSGAFIHDEQSRILDLIGKTVSLFTHIALLTDNQHPIARCAQQLRTLVRFLSAVDGSALTTDNMGDDPPQGTLEWLLDLTSEKNTVSNSSDSNTGKADNFVPEQDEQDPSSGTSSKSSAIANESFSNGNFQIDSLTALLSVDFDSDIWLSYFGQY